MLDSVEITARPAAVELLNEPGNANLRRRVDRAINRLVAASAIEPRVHAAEFMHLTWEARVRPIVVELRERGDGNHDGYGQLAHALTNVYHNCVRRVSDQRVRFHKNDVVRDWTNADRALRLRRLGDHGDR